VVVAQTPCSGGEAAPPEQSCLFAFYRLQMTATVRFYCCW